MTIEQKRSENFKNHILDFLINCAPGEPNSSTAKSMPSFWHGSFCNRVLGFFKIFYNIVKLKSLWNSEDVFKPIIDNEIVYSDGSPKKFMDIGRDEQGKKYVSCAIMSTDLGNSQSLAFTTERLDDEHLYFTESPFRRVLVRDENVLASLPMQASAALPFFLSGVEYPPYLPEKQRTHLVDGGAVSNLSAQLLKHDYGKREDAPVRIAISCNDFKYYRPSAYDYFQKTPKLKTKKAIDFAMALAITVIEDGMCDDVQQLLKTGGSKEHVFVIKAGEAINCPSKENPFLEEPVTNLGFLDLDKENIIGLFEFGAWITRNNLYHKMDSKELERAKRNGVTVACSGGGALFPVLFGAIHQIWSEGLTVHALAGTSAGALAASYMAEAITKEHLSNSPSS